MDRRLLWPGRVEYRLQCFQLALRFLLSPVLYLRLAGRGAGLPSGLDYSGLPCRFCVA